MYGNDMRSFIAHTLFSKKKELHVCADLIGLMYTNQIHPMDIIHSYNFGFIVALTSHPNQNGGDDYLFAVFSVTSHNVIQSGLDPRTQSRGFERDKGIESHTKTNNTHTHMHTHAHAHVIRIFQIRIDEHGSDNGL